MRLVCCLVLLLGGLQLASALLVAAWNIKTFGRTKTNKAAILEYIATIVQRYDVIVIQEVRGKPPGAKKSPSVAKKSPPVAKKSPSVVHKTIQKISPTEDPLAVTALMTAVNKHRQLYSHKVSEPLGRNTYKERYLFIYKTSSVTFNGSHQHENPKSKVSHPAQTASWEGFSRPPFAVKFKTVAQQNSFDFVMIPLHATPSLNGQTLREINALHDVVKALPRAWNTTNILLLGDFNADCDYLSKGEHEPHLTLKPAHEYHWLIHNGVRTNLARRQCTYDRIVATTAMMPRSAVPNVAGVKVYNAEPYDFSQALPLPAGVQDPTDVSDHLVVQVELQYKAA